MAMKRRGYSRRSMALAVVTGGVCSHIALMAYGGFAGSPVVCYWSVGVLSGVGIITVITAVSRRGTQVSGIFGAEVYLIYISAVSAGFALGAAAYLNRDSIVFVLVSALAWSVGLNLYSLRYQLGLGITDKPD